MVHGMPTKKMRVEIFNDGDRYTITFEGHVTREKALRLLDLVELLGGMPPVNIENNSISKIDKVRLAAEKNFPMGWFSSKELQEAYEQQYNEPVSLSTTSTYLSRLTDRGYFIKKSISNQLRYRKITTVSNYHLNERK